jgi:two-component system, OmpR family, phosphate regulon sensor histidine kinase PhoR
VKLTQRLLLGSFVVVSVLVICVVVVIDHRLDISIAQPGTSIQELVRLAKADVYIAGFLALALALVVALLFARAVSRPVVELRDVARALAAGDLTRRPSLTAPGEVGDLAIALHRLGEQLGSRVAALEAEDSLLTALFDSLNEGVIAIDARQRVVRINATGRRLLRTQSPVPFPLDYLPRERIFRESVLSALGGEVTEGAEAEIDGRTLALTARPLAAGGAVVAVLDLTATRRLEAVRRDFVANVSHELKTPLTVVGGFAETLTDEELPQESRRQFAETILANTRRMQRIVDDLLDLSRIESGGWVPKPTPIDVRAAVSDVVLPWRTAMEARGMAFELCAPDDAQVVVADPTALRQVLTNLVENAARHTTSGSITVTTVREVVAPPSPNRPAMPSAHSDTLPDPGVWITVRDTGVGIAAEHLPRIFERFYRVDRARSREAGGTGLGLAIVRHLVEAHGGRVRAESQVGRGTTVAVFFPDGPA